MVPAGNKAEHLLLINHTTKTIHHHHHHHHSHHHMTTRINQDTEKVNLKDSNYQMKNS